MVGVVAGIWRVGEGKSRGWARRSSQTHRRGCCEAVPKGGRRFLALTRPLLRADRAARWRLRPHTGQSALWDVVGRLLSPRDTSIGGSAQWADPPGRSVTIETVARRTRAGVVRAGVRISRLPAYVFETCPPACAAAGISHVRTASPPTPSCSASQSFR
ncbi:MAG: hypothetical protein ACI9VS_004317 [Candidatus Binatia bacterium]|jgi:hypothetical protein